MNRSGATTTDGPSAGRPSADTSAGVALFPAHAAAAGGLESDPVAMAIVVAVLVIATGGVVLMRLRTEDDGGTAESDPAPRSADGRSDAGRERGDDRDEIREILRSNGGRTRQTVIVEETGWSKAKVSSVLAEMDEQGEVSKLRVGRENLVSLPGHEPDAVDSPLED